MNLTRWSVEHPYLVTAIACAVAVLGLAGAFSTPRDLFPDTTPPQVLVVTVRQGASAPDMTQTVTEPLERELSGLEGLVNITSTTADGVSSVRAEFRYEKDVSEAVTEVRNALAAVTARFPSGTAEPLVYSVTNRTAPIMTIALFPEGDNAPTLQEIRLLAENPIRDELLSTAGVADVEVFGGHQPSMEVALDRDRLAATGLSLESVAGALAAQNVSIPSGRLTLDDSEIHFTMSSLFSDTGEIENTVVGSAPGGSILLGDVAEISLGEIPRRSLYHGNGKAAIALNVLRSEGSDTIRTVDRVLGKIPEIEARYRNIGVEVTDNQKPLIELNISGMYKSLVQAIILMVVVIFLFLANLRAALISSVSIALSFLFSLGVLWASPYNIDMVTLTGMIVAVGMVVDASVVVLENLYRVHAATGQKDIRASAVTGAKEVALSITAGMMTTVIVLLPVMGSSGYTSRVLRPLNMVIFATLTASLVAALTVIPLLATFVLKKERPKAVGVLERTAARFDAILKRLVRFYLDLLKLALRHSLVTLAAFGLFVVLTFKLVMPLLGGEMMPSMDTGVAFIQFETPAGRSPQAVEKTLSAMERRILADETVLAVSSEVGSEPQAVSFGGGSTPQSGRIKVKMVDRTKRDETIWEILGRWREDFEDIEGLRWSRLTEYGATPKATTKAPLDIIISGPDTMVLDSLAEKVMSALEGTAGLTDVQRTWHVEKEMRHITVDPLLAAGYGTSPVKVAGEVSSAIDGRTATFMRLPDFSDIPVRVFYGKSFLETERDVQRILVATNQGPVPLSALAKVSSAPEAPMITRENLKNTIDVTGVNRGRTISHVTSEAGNRLEGMELPDGYEIGLAGSAADLGESIGMLGKALLLGVVLLYFLLVSLFHSFSIPLTILSIVPPAVAGGLWGLLLFDKSMSMNAAMGFILLSGTIVNNSILLLDFIIESRKRGASRALAVMRSVKVRTRPILMTATSTIVGLTPLVMEWAVGLERMSPLGIVAATGLIFGTVLTMVFVPVVYVTLDDLVRRVKG
ncbi:MAG: efflux RND transporter permease subunit [Thermovirgaceae bacterium]